MKNNQIPLLWTLLLWLTKFCSSQNTQTGCVYTDNSVGEIECDFETWVPPLDEVNFNAASPPFRITITNINGTMANGSFSGLNAETSNSYKEKRNKIPYIYFVCKPGGSLEFDPEVFNGDVSWIDAVKISDCNVRNGIKENTFKNVSEIVTFEIDGGTVDTIHTNALSGLTRLTTLKMTSQLTTGTLPDGFLFPSTLEEIKINSDLTSISSTAFSGLLSLTSLDLKNNNLMTLTQGTLDPLLSLRDLKLNGNPWHCSCDMYWFVTWNVYTDVTLDAIVTCETPASYNGKYLSAAVFALGCNSGLQTTTQTTATTEYSAYDWTWKLIIIAIGAATLITFTCMIIIGCTVWKWYRRLKFGNQSRLTPVTTVSSGKKQPIVSNLEPLFHVNYKSGRFTY